MAKRITDGQILGERGIALIQSIVLQMGFTWHPSNAPVEAGIDGWVELRDRQSGEVANIWLAVQSKARTTLDPETETTVSFTCGKDDLEYWMTGNAPVILIASKPATGEAWWVSVKDYFRDKDIRRDKRITFDRIQNRFSAETADELITLGHRAGAGAYFTPVRRQEALVSNLQRLKWWKESIAKAPTEFRSGKELREALQEHLEWPPREWLLHEGFLYSFHDLSASPWCHACDADAMESFPASDWANSPSPDKQRLFTRLLNQCLRDIAGRWGMNYSEEEECYFFRATKDLAPRVVSYRSYRKKTQRTVFKAYAAFSDATRTAYYRHDGFSHRFRKLGESWYLEITPTYRFTSDGRVPNPYREEYLSKIKQIEGDAAVAGRVLMFADILKDHPSLFRQKHSFLTFGELENVVLDVSINDEAWRRIRAEGRESKSEVIEDQEAETANERQGRLFDR